MLKGGRPTGPSKLFVEVTTRCNLRCRMCVKQAAGCSVEEGDLTPETFAALEPALPGLDALVLSGIGEPLLHPELEAFVRRAKALLPPEAWVGFQTNGLLLDGDRAASLAAAGVDRVCLSLDAVSPAAFQRIREGGEVGAVDRALAALREVRGRSSPSRSRDLRPSVGIGRSSPSWNRDLRPSVGIEFVAMRDNVRELPAVLRWAASRGADFALVTQVLPYEPDLVRQAAYDPNTDRAVSFFEPWRERARAEGVDLGRYFAILWKYVKTPEEERIVEFVERAKAEAHGLDVFVNVQRILERDAAWLDEVQAVFAEAAEVAAGEGIELRLPEVVPRGDRRCDFVESGGAFVSWDGRVHPCYFLWHGYRCFVNGREKFIRPRVFGDLADRGIVEIWNDPAYRAFREGVLRYDYPFCSDCNLGKCCDYVQALEFEQDCYLNAEPCGDCLWCKGVFQCLQ
ncbi:MAG: radical SAM/SPASM family putative metalloenzyme maturase [Deltaproteobacteria bacterium]|nr:radical SAM/SPASM family putative metalloenzyme maturase [Deltaproteobacteria bacterium]